MRRWMWAMVWIGGLAMLVGCGDKKLTGPTAADLQAELATLDRLEKDLVSASNALESVSNEHNNETDSLRRTIFDEASRKKADAQIEIETKRWAKEVKRLEPEIDSLKIQIAEQRTVVDKMRAERKSSR